MAKIDNEQKQSKLCELSNLIMQYDNGERENINIDEYDNWVIISEMLRYSEIEEDIYDDFLINPNHYKVEDKEIIFNDNWEAEEEEKEKERISNLQCTKRVFVLMLEELGLDYFEQILPVIEANRQAKLEWDLCVELERKNPLLDQLALQFGVTSEQLDKLFLYANGEIGIEEFIPQE